ncbi:hypothetical protein [Tepidimonas sp.]|uniref:hypothetical protein n=1 Tax=Tepidimonas sp. TaxID=2002775 RepID=UPI0028CBCA8A|nr:hypothetical protein [Tepidimonas sp.]MDT7929105.1 hypothetical protein [Tepidimonas sp.]
MSTEPFPDIPPLYWSDALATGDARMDETHEEFVTQLAALRALPRHPPPANPRHHARGGRA